MANEPERPIEKLLRGAAKKRRDEAGAPLDLHPATRRLLQGEVARTFAKPKRKSRSFSEVLGRLWPRLAWGVAIFVVLAVGVYMLLPVPGRGKSEVLLARNEPRPQARPAPQPPPPTPSAAATVPAPPAVAAASNPSAVTLADTAPPAPAQPGRQFKAERQPLSKDSIAAPTERAAEVQPAAAAASQPANRHEAGEAEITASGGTTAQAPAGTANAAFDRQLGFAGKPAPSDNAPAAPASPAPVATMPAAAPVVAANDSAKLADEKAGQPSFAYALPGAVASAKRSSPSPAVTGGLSQSASKALKEAKGAGVVQWFAQVTPGPHTKAALADKATPAQPVLASFQVEQAGRALRIVDGDGSVYSGYVQIADAARRQRSIMAAAPAAAPAPGPGGVLEEKAAARLDSEQPAPPTYFFRVAGTNRSLHKKVVFTGNLIAATNSPLLPPGTNYLNFGSSLGAVRYGAGQPDLLPLLNSRITGKVVVGNGKAVDINALPTNP
jgi:hypothetical protein